jgi:multidrug resistance efflux pump
MALKRHHHNGRSVNRFIPTPVDRQDALRRGNLGVRTRLCSRCAVAEESLMRAAQKAENPADITGRPAHSGAHFARRLSQTALGLGIVGVLGFIPIQKLAPTSDVEAVINARVITLSAPIDGEVQTGPSLLEFDMPFARGDVLLRIVNERADRSRVDDLAREIQRLNDERPGIAARLADARMRQTDLTEQLHLFAEARTLQLEARQDELRAELAAAQAKNEEAKTTLDRFSTLASKGWTSRAQLNQAQRDGSIAEKSQAAAEKRLEAVGVELSAAQRGVFVGVGSNDRPRYMQRADQLEQQVNNLAENLAERDQRLVRLTEQLAGEKTRYGTLAAAEIIAPTKGGIWDSSVTPGQRVHRGQELLRALDCDRPVVTALLSEAVHNRLQVGSSAHFLPRGGREELAGQIIRFTPVSASNLAIQPSPVAGEAYYVTVSVPKLGEGGGCLVGRSGRLRFDVGPSETAAALRSHRRGSPA